MHKKVWRKRRQGSEQQENEDMLKRQPAEAVRAKQKCEMIIAVEEVIVFSWPKGNGSKNELNLNLQKLLLSVTIKHKSDTNNLISCFHASPCSLRGAIPPQRLHFALSNMMVLMS